MDENTPGYSPSGDGNNIPDHLQAGDQETSRDTDFGGNQFATSTLSEGVPEPTLIPQSQPHEVKPVKNLWDGIIQLDTIFLDYSRRYMKDPLKNDLSDLIFSTLTGNVNVGSKAVAFDWKIAQEIVNVYSTATLHCIKVGADAAAKGTNLTIGSILRATGNKQLIKVADAIEPTLKRGMNAVDSFVKGVGKYVLDNTAIDGISYKPQELEYATVAANGGR